MTPQKAAHNIPVLLFMLMAAVYLLTARGYAEVSDSVFSLRTAQSIVEKGTFAIEAGAAEDMWVFRSRSDGKTYSKYGIGLPLLWVPFAAAAKGVSALSGIKMMSALDFLASFYGVFFGPAVCVLAFALARRFGSSVRPAVISAIALGLCTVCWRYSVSDLSEIAQAFFLTASVYYLVKDFPEHITAASALFFALVLIKVFNAVYLPLFSGYIFFRAYPGAMPALKRTARFLVFPAAALIIIAALNYTRFGNPLESGYGKEAALFSPSGAFYHIVRMLILPPDGTFFLSPVLLLGAIGYAGLFGRFRAEAILFAAIILSDIILYSMWHSYSARFIVPVVPLIFVPAHKFFSGSFRARWAAAILCGVSFAAQLMAVMRSRGEYRQGIYLWYRLLSGEFNMPALEYVPLVFVPVIAVIVAKLAAAVRDADPSGSGAAYGR